MPYNNCQKIMEDGYRCNKQFRVPSHKWNLKFCPDCETNVKHKGNRMSAMGEDLKIKDYLKSLMEEYPSVKDIVPSQTQIDEIRKILKNFSDELDGMRLKKGEIERVLNANKTNVSKKLLEYSNMVNEELNNARKGLLKMTEPDAIKLEKQIVTLNNRIIKLEKRLQVIEDDWSDVDGNV